MLVRSKNSTFRYRENMCNNGKSRQKSSQVRNTEKEERAIEKRYI